jgi:hypothetical protein
MVSPVGLSRKDCDRGKASRAAEKIQSRFRGHRARLLKEEVLDTFAELCDRLAQQTGVEAGFAWNDDVIPRAWRSDAAAAAAAAAAANAAPEAEVDEAELLCYSDGEAEEPLAMERLHLEQPATLNDAHVVAASCRPTAGDGNWQPMSTAKPALSPCAKRNRTAGAVSAPSAAEQASEARSLYVSMSGSLESLLHADTQRGQLAADDDAACTTQNYSAEQAQQQQQQQLSKQQDSGSSSALQSREELLAELAWVKAALASRILHLKRDHGTATATAAAHGSSDSNADSASIWHKRCCLDAH